MSFAAVFRFYSERLREWRRGAGDLRFSFATSVVLMLASSCLAQDSQSLTFGDLSIWSQLSGKKIEVRLCDRENFTAAECQKLAENFVSRTGVEFIEPLVIAADESDPKFAQIIPACMSNRTDEMFFLSVAQMPEARAYGPYAAYQMDRSTRPELRNRILIAIRGFRGQNDAPGEEYGWTFYDMIDDSLCQSNHVDRFMHGALAKQHRRRSKFADGLVFMWGQYFLYGIEESGQGSNWFQLDLWQLEQHEFGGRHIPYAVTWTITPQ